MEDKIKTNESGVLVIETNGDIEASPALKSCGNGFTKEGNNVRLISFDQVLQTDLIKECIESEDKLCNECLHCEIKNVCKGGRINERFSIEKRFDNPSIYCLDIKLLVKAIQNELLNTFSAKELNENCLEKL